MKLKFTQKIKDNWLAALKSGKYTQCKVRLRNNEENNKINKDGVGHCCLGVLAEIHPDLSIADNGGDCLYKNENVGYQPFDKLLGENIVAELYGKNDTSFREGKRDYSAVIPLIEQIPVE